MAGKVISRFQSGSGIHLISSTFYGTCNTAADEPVKLVKINDEHITELKLIPGMLLSVKFTNGNTATNPKLKIFDSTNNVLKDVVSITPNILTWGAGEVILFVYDNSNNNEQWISNYLSVSGGTLTGSVILNNKSIYFDQNNLTVDTVPTESVNGNSRIYFRDTANNTMGYIVPHTNSADNQYLRINCTRGSKEHSLYLGIKANGDKIVSLTATPWRTALGIGAIGLKDTLTASDIPNLDASKITSGTYGRTSVGTLDWGTNNGYLINKSALAYWNGAYSGTASNLAYCNKGAFGTMATRSSIAASDISSGTLPIANGGTGKATTTLVNYVFASPTASVTVATAPSWRKLVAADIPNLNTSKLTAGILGIAHGGTGSSQVVSIVNNSTLTIFAWGPLVMVQLHGLELAPGTSTTVSSTAYLADYKPGYNVSALVSGPENNDRIARLWVGKDDGKVYLNAVNTTTKTAWYGTLVYMRVPT